MAYALSNLGLNRGWVLGEDGWLAGVELNWLLLDTLVQGRVINVGLDAPPAEPNEGECYIVGTTPTGAWSGHAGEIMIRNESTWVAIAPLEGWCMYDRASKADYQYDGSAWRLKAARNNYIATGNPGATNDETEGFGRGSEWLNETTEHFFICCNPAAGAAVWKQITA